MKNIIPFPNAHSGESNGNELPAPDDYLEALEVALERSSSLEQFENTVDSFLASVSNDCWFRTFSRATRILARVDWKILRLERPAPETNSEEAKDLVRVCVKLSSEREKQRSGAEKEQRHYFPAALSYLNAFDLLYGNDSPIDYINHAIKTLFPETPYKHPLDCWFAGDECLVLDETRLDFLLKKIIVPLMRVPDSSLGNESLMQELPLGRLLLHMVAPRLEIYWSTTIDSIEKQLKSMGPIPLKYDSSAGEVGGKSSLQSLIKHTDTIEGLLALLLRPGLIPLAQGMLVALIGRIIDASDELDEALIGVHLLNWPIGTPPASWTEIANGLSDPTWLSTLKQEYPTPESVPFVPCGMLATNLFVVYGFDVEFADSCDYPKVMQQYSDKILRLSERHLDGRYPWYFSDTTNFWGLSDGCPVGEDWNLLLLLQISDEEEVEIYSNGIGYFGSDMYGDNPEHQYSSFSIYKTLWRQAYKEGFAKLANALFAFYLVRKTIASIETNIAPSFDWQEFQAQIELCLAKSGSHWIKRALQISTEVFQEKGWNVFSLKFDSLLTQDVPTVNERPHLVRSDETLVDLSGDVAKRHEIKFGSRWLKLSDRMRRILCHADARFERDSRDLGYSDTEHGGLAVDYAKAFEVELDHRLREIYLDSETQQSLAKQVPGWRRDTTPALGQYVLMLEKTESMPEGIRQQIRTKTGKLAESKAILANLKKLKKVRNDGAHGGNVNASDVTKVRELIHAKGLLQGFLDALS